MRNDWAYFGEGVDDGGFRNADCVFTLFGCLRRGQISAKIEEGLGRVVHTEKTEEYFQEAYDGVQVKNEVKTHVVQRGDPFFVSDPNIPSW